MRDDTALIEKLSEVKVPIGIWIIVAFNCIAGIASIYLGFVNDGFLYFGVELHVFWTASGLLLIITSIGLLKLKRWAWYLSIVLDTAWMIYTLVKDFTSRSFGIPLEPFVIAYLIWKRGLFFKKPEREEMKC